MLLLDPASAAHTRLVELRKGAKDPVKNHLSGGDGARRSATGADEVWHARTLLGRIPAALGLAAPLVPEESFSVQHLMHEVRELLPPSFSLALLEPRAGAPEDVVSLPLQRADEVAEQVLAALRDDGAI